MFSETHILWAYMTTFWMALVNVSSSSNNDHVSISSTFVCRDEYLQRDNNSLKHMIDKLKHVPTKIKSLYNSNSKKIFENKEIRITKNYLLEKTMY